MVLFSVPNTTSTGTYYLMRHIHILGKNAECQVPKYDSEILPVQVDEGNIPA